MGKDQELKDAVLAELKWEPRVTAAHIGVTAKDGVVTLSGRVGTYPEKYAAEKAAGRVKGVKAVAEEIEVDLVATSRRSDDQIAKAVIDRLAWAVSLPHDAVKVKVEKGTITLSGQVDWHYQKDAAENDVWGLLGVVGVDNAITIKPDVNVRAIDDQITHAIARSWFFEPKAIRVTADGGKVKLAGTVQSWNDRRVAESIAWSAKGATAVDNQITVA